MVMRRLGYTFGHRCTIPLIKAKTIHNMAPSVLTSESSSKGVIILNRPKALNAVNYEMVGQIYEHLKKFENTKKLVIVKGTGDKSFCAGGDVVNIVKGGASEESKDFFRKEYTTNALIANYKIPYIALIHGITMGGGVGLSVHGKYRVATEHTLFAMPETAIGLFPDVGGSYFLPRLQGKLGLYLGLTGYRLKGEDVLKAGIATHFTESKKMCQLLTALLDCQNVDEVPDILQKFNASTNKEFVLQPLMKQINECFSAECVEGIVENLKCDGTEWAKKTIETMGKLSPTSLKVTFRQLQLGANMSLPECLKMEFRLVVHHLENSDFKEGVRALLIDKDQKPCWKPSTLEAVSDERVQSFFAKLPETEELKL